MGLGLGKIGEAFGKIAGTAFAGALGSAVGAKVGGLLGGMAEEIFKSQPKPKELIQQMLDVLGASNVPFISPQALMSEMKSVMKPADYYRFENDVEEMHKIVSEMLDVGADLNKKKVGTPKGEGDWFMAIAEALAQCIQKQADNVKAASDKIQEPGEAGNDQLKAQTELKAESMKLEYLTTALNTVLDKISGSINALGRAN